MMPEYPAYVEQLHVTHPALATIIAGFITLEHVLNWMQRESLSYASLDLVTQDEYCHDLVVPLANSEWLVFGMT